jgi:transcription initiation factor TFIIIB Brf1 subunit/transcription initiation factor TFIIB
MNYTSAQIDELYKKIRETSDKKEEEEEKDEFYMCTECEIEGSIQNVGGVYTCNKCGLQKCLEIDNNFKSQYAGLANGDNSATAHSGLAINNLFYENSFTTRISGKHSSYGMKIQKNVWANLTPEERSLSKVFKKITENCRENGIPKNVISFSQVLFKQAVDKQKEKLKRRNSRGDNRIGLRAGCIYHACKKYGINRSHQEIAKVCETSKSVVSNGSKLVFTLLGEDISLNMNVTSYKDFLARYTYFLSLSGEEIKQVRDICRSVNNLEILSSSKPQTLVAVCIQFANIIYNFQIDKKTIAEKCNTTETTINKYKLLLDYIEQLI